MGYKASACATVQLASLARCKNTTTEGENSIPDAARAALDVLNVAIQRRSLDTDNQLSTIKFRQLRINLEERLGQYDFKQGIA